MTAPVYQQYPPQQAQWPVQQQGFAQQAPVQFPAQQFAPGYPPAAPAAPAQPLAQGSIDDFYSQPSSGGGAALKFEAINTSYTGIVTRPITSADIQQQTNTQGIPQFFKDGRPKFVMKVPLQLQPTPDRPDGLAQWFVKGQARDELVRAMAEAGAPAGPPEPGAIICVTYVSQRASGAGMNPAKQFHVVYTRPSGEASSPAPQAAPQPVAQQFQGVDFAAIAAQQAAAAQAAQAQQPVAQQNVARLQEDVAAVSPYVQAAMAETAALRAQQEALLAAAQAAQAQQPVAQARPAAPADLTPEQQALLARLTGGQPQG